MSFLKNIVSDMLKETAQQTFVNKIHEQTGVSVDKLNEVFHSGMSLMTNIDSDPIVMGKSSVYQFLDELGDEELEEGDVVPFERKKKPVKHCTCPFDDKDDTKDMGTDPDCCFHGKNGSKVKENAQARRRKLPNASLDCDTCKGDGCKSCDFTGRKTLEGNLQEKGRDARWTNMVDHIVSMAMKDKIEPAQLQRKAERMERLGDPKAAVYFDAAEKYSKTDVFRSEDASEEPRVHQIIDKNTKQPVGKPSTNLKRLHRKADKLDMEYGAIRYIVTLVK